MSWMSALFLAHATAIAAPLGLSSTDMIAGSGGTFTVDGAGAPLAEGVSVWFMKGEVEGAGPCPEYLEGACWGITDPRFVHLSTTDSEGVATWNVTLDERFGVGSSTSMQAATGGPEGVRLSNAASVTVESAADPLATCEEANGLLWCYSPVDCGRACEDTCADVGLTALADSNAWFEAQNTVAECEAVAAAFGNFLPVEISAWSYTCMDDGHGTDHSGGGGIDMTTGFVCSTNPDCPNNKRWTMDHQGNSCDAALSRYSVCPCE
jgi:hypothetical protein